MNDFIYTAALDGSSILPASIYLQIVISIGDLVEHRNYEQYGIVLNIFTPEGSTGAYFVILWEGRLESDWVWDDMVVRA